MGALEEARVKLDGDLDHPFQRNVILISDGVHNFPNMDDFTGDEGMNGKYRIFAVSVDSRLDDNGAKNG